MIKREYVQELRENMRGGNGTVTIKNWAHGDEKPANMRLAATLEIPEGASIGMHKHEGEAEIYNVVSGAGEYNDNGNISDVSAGDVMVCYSGEEHGIKNTGSGKLVLNAFIVLG